MRNSILALEKKVLLPIIAVAQNVKVSFKRKISFTAQNTKAVNTKVNQNLSKCEIGYVVTTVTLLLI